MFIVSHVTAGYLTKTPSFSCENLAARGYIVYATSRSLTSMDDLRHPNIRKHVCDVTKDQQVESVVSKIMVEEKRVDLLINNAGIPGVGVFTFPLQKILCAFDVVYLSTRLV